jgi:pimeloyl-ACP methyl ester carboxylesterase
VPLDLQSGLHYEVYGTGLPVFLAPYFVSTQSPALPGYVDGLAGDFRVLVIDPPGEGLSAPLPAAEFTADEICRRMLAVADAAGFTRFVWCGYSWGAVVGLQLACRCDRLLALVCGGWPPLGGEYAKMLRGAQALVREPPTEGAYAGFDATPFVTFYESVQSWPESEAVARIGCPRWVLYGSNDATSIGVETVEIAATIRAHETELRRLGWGVSEIAAGDHGLVANPSVVVPVLRRFLSSLSA